MNGIVYAFVVGKGLIKGREPTPRWRVLSRDFGTRHILHLAVDPTNEDYLYAVTREGEILSSKDGGSTWITFDTR